MAAKQKQLSRPYFHNHAQHFVLNFVGRSSTRWRANHPGRNVSQKVWINIFCADGSGFLMNPGRNRMLELMLNRLAMGPARYLLNKRENNSGSLTVPFENCICSYKGHPTERRVRRMPKKCARFFSKPVGAVERSFVICHFVKKCSSPTLRTSENSAIFPERKGLMFDTYPWALRFDVLRQCVGARFAEVLQMRALYGFLLNEPANKQMMAYNANALPNAEVWTHRVNWHFYRWNPCHWFMRQHTKVQRYFLGVHSWSGWTYPNG